MGRTGPAKEGRDGAKRADMGCNEPVWPDMGRMNPKFGNAIDASRHHDRLTAELME
jgi:hypothetical protein